MIDQKKSLAKEKSPACEKFPEILHNGSKNHNSSLASLARQTGDFCFRHCSEFLTGNFSDAGLFLKEKIKLYSELKYTYNNQFKFILDTTAWIINSH